MYKSVFKILNVFFSEATLLKVMFNYSPMYSRSCGKVYYVSEDLHLVKIKIPLNYKNRNYVGSTYGGSLFSATDPVYMIQLMRALGDDYVVWDKATNIRFKKPVYSDSYADFHFTKDEIKDIVFKVNQQKEIDYVKKLHITDKDGKIVFTELEKTLYISSKEHYKEKKSTRV